MWQRGNNPRKIREVELRGRPHLNDRLDVHDASWSVVNHVCRAEVSATVNILRFYEMAGDYGTLR